MKHYLLYGHGGAYNHGSEAAVRCTIALLRERAPGCRVTLCSHFPEQDRAFGMDADELVGRDLSAGTNAGAYAGAIRRITADTVCLSVGGDNYCYPNWQRYAAIHYAALERGAKSVLWSCSVEPSMLDEEMLGALRTHHRIAVRESLSYRALTERGLTNVVQTADAAFLLPPQETELPPRPYAALNLSPLALRKHPLVLNAYQRLTDEIIERTDWNVALVPHVEMPSDNDCEALSLLTGPEARLYRVPPGLTAAQYKYIIGHAELCAAARTHAAIAAWSAGVPSLVLAYSAKARGIARDLGQESCALDLATLDGARLCGAFWELATEKVAVRAALAGRKGTREQAAELTECLSSI